MGLNVIKRQSMDCGTVHITQRDSELLEQFAVRTRPNSQMTLTSPVVYQYNEGFIIWVPSEEGYGRFRALEHLGFSPEFVQLMIHAKDANCDFLHLDCDGTKYEDLPKFSW